MAGDSLQGTIGGGGEIVDKIHFFSCCDLLLDDRSSLNMKKETSRSGNLTTIIQSVN